MGTTLSGSPNFVILCSLVGGFGRIELPVQNSIIPEQLDNEEVSLVTNAATTDLMSMFDCGPSGAGTQVRGVVPAGPCQQPPTCST